MKEEPNLSLYLKCIYALIAPFHLVVFPALIVIGIPFLILQFFYLLTALVAAVLAIPITLLLFFPCLIVLVSSEYLRSRELKLPSIIWGKMDVTEIAGLLAVILGGSLSASLLYFPTAVALPILLQIILWAVGIVAVLVLLAAVVLWLSNSFTLGGEAHERLMTIVGFGVTGLIVAYLLIFNPQNPDVSILDNLIGSDASSQIDAQKQSLLDEVPNGLTPTISVESLVSGTAVPYFDALTPTTEPQYASTLSAVLESQPIEIETPTPIPQSTIQAVIDQLLETVTPTPETTPAESPDE